MGALKAIWNKLRSWLCRLHLFLGRHKCLRGLLVLIAVAAVAALWAVLFAPDKVRQVALKVESTAEFVAAFLPARLPPATRVDAAHWLPQNWDERDRYWFHHTPQGTATIPIPMVWFLALERPEFSIGHSGYIRDEAFMRRLGFIPSPDLSTLRKGGARRYGYLKGETIDPALKTERDVATNYPDNAHALPVGFAKLTPRALPDQKQKPVDLLGFTCAACHTGHIEYRNVSIRFDGGPAMANLGELERAIGLAIGYTVKFPLRFRYFASEVERLTGEKQDRPALKKQLQGALAKILQKKQSSDRILHQHQARHVEEGYGRLDALNRIGNQVFFTNLQPPDDKAIKVLPDALLAANFARIDAPVSFPPIWGAPWFSWAQYDASVQNELVRNAGEALGVNARVNLRDYGDKAMPTFRSSVQMQNIFWFERLLAGREHPLAGDKGFKGLLAPAWADAAKLFPGDAAWAIKDDLAAKGRTLYRELCAECHRPPVRDKADTSLWDQEQEHWITMGGERYLNVVQKPVDVMGTDPQQARVLTERRVNLPAALGLRPIAHLNKQDNCGIPGEEPDPTPGGSVSAPFVLALMAVVDRTIAQWFDDTPQARPFEKVMRGPRRNCQNERVFRTVKRLRPENAQPELHTVPHYRARPLDGVWATAPYLHNGSVPTLHDMLLPQHERPKVFCVGNRQFDPVKVGLAEMPGGCGPYTRFDADGLGNGNLGHSFEGKETDVKKLPNGVIGRGLTQDERNALVEYLKTL
jgi:mono/diheme cytochrome c family protein